MKKVLLILIVFIPFQAIAEPWEVEGKVLHPRCFQTEWSSSDNIQEFYERFMGIKENYYGTKEYEDFRLNIGKYWGKEINHYGSITASWGDEIELAVSMKSCLNKSSNEVGERDQWVTSSEQSDEYSYRVSKKISLEQCKLLAPNLEGECVQSYLLEIYNWGGGSMGFKTLQIFGLFEMPNKKRYIFPLKKF